MVKKYLTFRCLLQIWHAIKFKFAVQAKRAWTICCFVSCGRSLYRWKVTVARPRIDGVGPNSAVFGRFFLFFFSFFLNFFFILKKFFIYFFIKQKTRLAHRKNIYIYIIKETCKV